MSYPTFTDYHTVVFDFDGVFTNNKVYLQQDGLESIRCDRRDGLAFQFIRHAKAKGLWQADLFVLSKEPNPVVLMRTSKLQLICHQGVQNKLAFMTDYFSKSRPKDADPFAGLVYIGNDLNDLAVMRRAKWSFAPADAHAAIQKCATLVLPERGGDGFVRAVVEGLLRMDRMTVDELETCC